LCGSIAMIDKININAIHFDGSTPEKTARPKSPQNQPDATLQINYRPLIEQATKMPPDDTNAVQRAKELLQSGRLDSPANIKEAAEEISFGV
jgi:hypothetical protein